MYVFNDFNELYCIVLIYVICIECLFRDKSYEYKLNDCCTCDECCVCVETMKSWVRVSTFYPTPWYLRIRKANFNLDLLFYTFQLIFSIQIIRNDENC